MKQPVPITVTVALSDKEYSYPSWMRSQSIASPPLLSPVPSNISLTVCLRPFILLREGGGEEGGK